MARTMENIMNLIKILICATFLALPARRVTAEQLDFDQHKIPSIQNIKDAGNSVPAAAKPKLIGNLTLPAFLLGPASGTKDWTVMVYMNGKNDLEQYALADFNEMEKVGSTARVNVVAEVGRMKGYDSSDGDWTGSRRYLVKQDKDPVKVNSYALQQIPNADMGDWNHLVNFVQWAKANFPANKYMLIIWNHGSGWKSVNIKKTVPFQTTGISYDFETGHHISTVEMGKAFGKMGKLDVYASDACLMQMAEIDYEIRAYVDIAVGSEEVEPGDGYAYDTFLQNLTFWPQSSSIDAAKMIVKSYADYYKTAPYSATQSVVRTSAVPGLMPLLDQWADLLMSANEIEAVKLGANTAKQYSDPDSKDLYDYVQIVSNRAKSPAVKQKGQEIMNYIAKTLVLANGSVGKDAKKSHGIAVYIPRTAYDQSYDNLLFARDGGWDEFIKWSVAARY